MDTCTECGYSYGTLERPDITPMLVARAEPYSEILGRCHPDRLRAHPRPGVWSALEYACHVRDVHLVQRARVLQAVAEDQPDFSSMRREERVGEQGYNDQDPTQVSNEITAAARTLSRTLERLDDAGWQRTGVYHWPTTETRTVEWIGRHTVHESIHHLQDIERLIAQSP